MLQIYLTNAVISLICDGVHTCGALCGQQDKLELRPQICEQSQSIKRVCVDLDFFGRRITEDLRYNLQHHESRVLDRWADLMAMDKYQSLPTQSGRVDIASVMGPFPGRREITYPVQYKLPRVFWQREQQAAIERAGLPGNEGAESERESFAPRGLSDDEAAFLREVERRWTELGKGLCRA